MMIHGFEKRKMRDGKPIDINTAIKFEKLQKWRSLGMNLSSMVELDRTIRALDSFESTGSSPARGWPNR